MPALCCAGAVYLLGRAPAARSGRSAAPASIAPLRIVPLDINEPIHGTFPNPLVLSTRTFATLSKRLQRSQPAAFALHVPGRSSLTYGDLGAQIRYVREHLGDWGIAPGDIVAGVLPSRRGNGCCLRDAALLVHICAARCKPDDRCLCAAHRSHGRARGSRASGARTSDSCGGSAAWRGGNRCRLRARCARRLFTLDLRQKRDSLRAAPAARSELAYILVSSGTTGRPKLVPSTHRQTLLYAKAARDWLAYSPQDVGCHLTPIHLGNGLRSGLINPLLAGLSIVCLPESDVDAFFAAHRGIPAHLFERQLRAAPRDSAPSARISRSAATKPLSVRAFRRRTTSSRGDRSSRRRSRGTCARGLLVGRNDSHFPRPVAPAAAEARSGRPAAASMKWR